MRASPFDLRCTITERATLHEGAQKPESLGMPMRYAESDSSARHAVQELPSNLLRSSSSGRQCRCATPYVASQPSSHASQAHAPRRGTQATATTARHPREQLRARQSEGTCQPEAQRSRIGKASTALRNLCARATHGMSFTHCMSFGVVWPPTYTYASPCAGGRRTLSRRRLRACSVRQEASMPWSVGSPPPLLTGTCRATASTPCTPHEPCP